VAVERTVSLVLGLRAMSNKTFVLGVWKFVWRWTTSVTYTLCTYFVSQHLHTDLGRWESVRPCLTKPEHGI
jgi:hypothetical protein